MAKPIIFGTIPGIEEGFWFSNRKEMMPSSFIESGNPELTDCKSVLSVGRLSVWKQKRQASLLYYLSILFKKSLIISLLIMSKEFIANSDTLPTYQQ